MDHYESIFTILKKCGGEHAALRQLYGFNVST